VSTIKSSAENLTLNADGANNDIIFQSNGSNVATLDQAGLLTATTFAGSGASLTALPAANITGTLPAIDGSNLTGLSSGLSSASTFRLQADHSTNADMTNWAEATGGSDGRLGTAVSQSSGVFTFPSTGIWWISAQITFHGAANDQTTCNIQATTDNSSYSSMSYCTRTDNDGNVNETVPMSLLVDVTDTSNVKVKFLASSLNSGSFIWGSSSQDRTSATFIKLGET
jgi:hypothetical protein